MKKFRKNTKTYKEFSRMIKNLVEIRRYYGKKGIDVPDVRDYYTRSDASGANLRGLKKFKKQIIDPFISDIKAKVKGIVKDKGLSTKVAYKRLSALLSGPAKAADVTIETFYKNVESFANADTRTAMKKFMVEFEGAVEDRDELARILQETAEEDEAFEMLQRYQSGEQAYNNLANLITNMLHKLQETQPITAEDLLDRVEEFVFY